MIKIGKERDGETVLTKRVIKIDVVHLAGPRQTRHSDKDKRETIEKM